MSSRVAVPDPLGPAWPLLEALADALGAVLWRKDAAGRYLRLNAAGARALGLASPEAAHGLDDARLLSPVLAERLGWAAAAVPARPLLLDLGPPGAPAPYLGAQLRLDPPAADGSAQIGLWLDARSQQQAEHALREALGQIEALQAAHEQLSRALQPRVLAEEPVPGLYPPAQFEVNLRRELDLSRREHREFALVLIEPDREPPEGPPLSAADRPRVLAALGRLLRGGTRAMDTPCRLDGERHALLMSGCGLAAAHKRMEGFRRQCAGELVVVDGRVLRFSIAVGIAAYPTSHDTAEPLRDAAEAALREAQAHGGNQVALARIPFAA